MVSATGNQLDDVRSLTVVTALVGAAPGSLGGLPVPDPGEQHSQLERPETVAPLVGATVSLPRAD
jgi:hypothetical protein